VTRRQTAACKRSFGSPPGGLSTRRGRFDLYRELAERCWRERSLGDFWGHMLVARGAAQVMVDPIVALWDYLPLEPIVREAGGTMTQLDGSALVHDGSCLTTCGGAMHEAVMAISRSGSPR